MFTILAPFILGFPWQPLVLPPPVDPVPVVSQEDFTVGRTWTWDYREETGALFSTETYEVVANHNGVVEIGMSTQFPNRPHLPLHHLIRADVQRCLDAYKNSAQRKPWSLQLFFWDKDHWLDTGADQTLAFEEKFNCNPHSKASFEQKAVIFRLGDTNELFLIPRKGKLENSWFNRTGENTAVQAEKEFFEKGTPLFRSKLRTENVPSI